MKENEDNREVEKDIQDLTSIELDELQKELNSTKDQLMRSVADMENLRRRMNREIDNAAKFATQEFITRMLPAKDSMEKGIDIAYMEDGIDGEALFEGMTSTLRICNEAFKSVGLEEIDPLGKKFDPELHEAMAIKPSDGLPNMILSVFQKGYLLNGRLIRPARVEVSTNHD